jgi:hypothetical protein
VELRRTNCLTWPSQVPATMSSLGVSWFIAFGEEGWAGGMWDPSGISLADRRGPGLLDLREGTQSLCTEKTRRCNDHHTPNQHDGARQ